MSSEILLTSEGQMKLKKELDFLKDEKRVEIANRIRHAKDYGDLSENAEYHEAKEDQAFVEGRIMELEHMIKTARIVDKLDSDKVGIGSKVTVDRNGDHMEFTIVGATESDPANGKITIDSPLGTALVDKKIGDIVTVTTPGGLVEYRIKSIE